MQNIAVYLSICHFACKHEPRTVFYSTIVQLLLLIVDELFKLIFRSVFTHLIIEDTNSIDIAL
jgi:hypothetical protein